MRRHYEVARKWVDFLQTKANDLIIEIGISDHESIDPKPTATATATFKYTHRKVVLRFMEISYFFVRYSTFRVHYSIFKEINNEYRTPNYE